MEPKISFIVPVYDVENYIDRCITSLTEQTLSDIEIILVDDGSTDMSGNICDEYMMTDERVTVIHKENEGQGYARNDGLLKATGKYVCFLDSDDYLELNTASDLFYLLEEKEADMVSFGYEIDSPDGEVVRTPLIRNDEYEGKDIVDRFVLHFFGDDPSDENLRGFSSCMSCFRRSVIEENGIRFPSEREVLTEDTIFCLEFCKKAKKVVTTDKVYYHYCQKADSFSQGYRADRMEKTLEMQRILKLQAQSFGFSEREDIKIRLAMYVWVNLMASMKQETRQKYIELSDNKKLDANHGEANNKKSEVNKIKQLCNDEKIRESIAALQTAKLPLKQKVLFYAYWLRIDRVVYMLCSARAKQRI